MSENTSDASTWFAVLRAARKSGDRELERMARQHLEAEGYRVIFQRAKPTPQQEAAR